MCKSETFKKILSFVVEETEVNAEDILSLKKTAEIVGDSVGLKARQVQKYIRLTDLVPNLMEYVDQKKIPIT